MHFGENQLSRNLIGLSPLTPSHPPSFQPRWVRSSTRSYPRFNLLRARSSRFGSRARDSNALFRLAFATRTPHGLRSPRTTDSQTHFSIGTPSPLKAPTVCKRMVSDTISLPSRGTFHLSLTVLVRYRSHGNIQAYPTVWTDSRGIPRVPRYLGERIDGPGAAGYGAITLYGREFNPVRLTPSFITIAAPVGGRTTLPTTPRTQPPTGITRTRFSHHPLSLATTHGISSPAGTEMFHFPAYPPHKKRCQPIKTGGFPHSDTLGSKPGRRLPEAYRGPPRPSSVPCAKASTIRPSRQHTTQSIMRSPKTLHWTPRQQINTSK